MQYKRDDIDQAPAYLLRIVRADIVFAANMAQCTVRFGNAFLNEDNGLRIENAADLNQVPLVNNPPTLPCSAVTAH